MLWRACTSLGRAAPWALAAARRSSCSPAGPVLAARTTTALLNTQTAQFHEQKGAAAPNFRLVLVGTALGALISSEADSQPKKKRKPRLPGPSACSRRPAAPTTT